MSYVDPQEARQHYQGREIQLYGQQRAGFDGQSSYKQDYPAHPMEARQAPRTQQWAGNPAKFDGTTTYGAEFYGRPLPERAAGPANEYQPTAAPFDGTSTYNSHFQPHQLERPSPRRGPNNFERANVPFDGTTSYRDNYTAHPMPERAAHMGAPYQPNSAPFDGATTYKDNYVPHAFEGRPAPTNRGAPHNPLPFDGSTTYGDNFKPYPILPREGMQRGQYQPSDARFEGQSETMDKYRAWAIDPANRQGRGPPPMRPCLPFEGATTHKEMFKGWQLPPKRPALGVQMVGDMAYVLIPANAPVPAMGRQVFTTVHDNQAEISVLVLEGDFSQASRCNVLGQFDLTGLPPGPMGSAKVEITFYVDQNGVLSASALELNTQRHEQWLRQGYMVARV